MRGKHQVTEEPCELNLTVKRRFCSRVKGVTSWVKHPTIWNQRSNFNCRRNRNRSIYSGEFLLTLPRSSLDSIPPPVPPSLT
jgi:hypothetical protein